MPRTKQFNEEEVLEKAVQLFWKQGFAATSMQDLVNHLGLSRSSIYDTFQDKDTLFNKALEHYVAQSKGVFTMVQKVLAGELNARTFIERLLKQMATESLEDPERKGCFASNSTAECANNNPEVAALLITNKERFVSTLEKAIEAGKGRGEILSKKPGSILAFYVFTFLNGMRIMSKIDSDVNNIHQSIEMLMSAFDTDETT